MWFKYALIFAVALSVVSRVAQVGKPRKPVSAAEAAWVVFENSAWVAGILYYWR